MVEQKLAPDVLAKASVHLGEYAWQVPVVFEAIEEAARKRLAVVVGDPRIELPQGIYEYSVDTGDDEEMQREGESWGAFVERAAAEAQSAIRRLSADRTWIEGQEFVPTDLKDLWWVLYFVEEGEEIESDEGPTT